MIFHWFLAISVSHADRSLSTSILVFIYFCPSARLKAFLIKLNQYFHQKQFDKINQTKYSNNILMNITDLKYISDEKGERIAVIVPIELWEELTSEDNIDATEELLSIAGFESAFKKANRQVEKGKTKGWREIRDDV